MFSMYSVCYRHQHVLYMPLAFQVLGHELREQTKLKFGPSKVSGVHPEGDPWLSV